MKKSNILQEAIADAKDIQEAAYANASMMFSNLAMKNVQQFISESINEGDDAEDEDCDVKEMYGGEDKPMTEEEDYEVEETEEEEAPEGEEEDVMEGLTEEDLEEALESALSEVTHGDLGEMELVMNDVPGSKSPEGLEKVDTKEDGWETKQPPQAKSHSLATGEQYHQENLQLKKKVKQLVSENVVLKKANEKIKEALRETQLFNTKMFYAQKLIRKEGITPKLQKVIVEKMDKVGSMKEAKNLFEAFETALGSLSEQAAPQKAAKGSSLTEALGSHSVSGTGKGVSGDSLTESWAARNKKLAGLIKD